VGDLLAARDRRDRLRAGRPTGRQPVGPSREEHPVERYVGPELDAELDVELDVDAEADPP